MEEKKLTKKITIEREDQVVSVESQYNPENPEGDDGVVIACVVINKSK